MTAEGATGPSATTSSGAGGRPGESVEIEVKFDVGEDVELPILLGLPDVAAVEQPVEQQLAATYFDTADLALARARITLRRRTGGTDAGWHLKLPKAAHARLEVHRPLGRSTRTAPKALLDIVRAYVRDQAVVPVATLHTQRSVHRLLDADGGVLADVADDRVVGERLVEPAQPAQTWRELEVEHMGGDVALLGAVGERLLAAGARPARSASKLARVLGDAVTPPVATELASLRPSSPAGEVVHAYLAEQAAAVMTWDRSARTDEPDAVHKMRVATRRLRSALATFRPLLDRAVTDPVRDELKWLGQVLGEPRDAEVMLARVLELVRAEPDDLVLGPVARRVDLELHNRHRDAHARMLGELNGERYFRLLTSLDELIAAPPLHGRISKSAKKVLPSLVKHARKRVLTAAAEADSETDPARHDDLLHEVRKAAKRARYAGESAAPALGDKATDFAAKMEDLQEVLGEHQDSAVTRDLLRELAVQAHLAGENAFSFGRLHGLEQTRGERAAEHYEGALGAVRDKRPSWLDA